MEFCYSLSKLHTMLGIIVFLYHSGLKVVAERRLSTWHGSERLYSVLISGDRADKL